MSIVELMDLIPIEILSIVRNQMLILYAEYRRRIQKKLCQKHIRESGRLSSDQFKSMIFYWSEDDYEDYDDNFMRMKKECEYFAKNNNLRHGDVIIVIEENQYSSRYVFEHDNVLLSLSTVDTDVLDICQRTLLTKKIEDPVKFYNVEDYMSPMLILLDNLTHEDLILKETGGRPIPSNRKVYMKFSYLYYHLQRIPSFWIDNKDKTKLLSLTKYTNLSC